MLNQLPTSPDLHYTAWTSQSPSSPPVTGLAASEPSKPNIAAHFSNLKWLYVCCQKFKVNFGEIELKAS